MPARASDGLTPPLLSRCTCGYRHLRVATRQRARARCVSMCAPLLARLAGSTGSRGTSHVVACAKKMNTPSIPAVDATTYSGGTAFFCVVTTQTSSESFHRTSQRASGRMHGSSSSLQLGSAECVSFILASKPRRTARSSTVLAAARTIKISVYSTLCIDAGCCFLFINLWWWRGAMRRGRPPPSTRPG